MWRRCRPGGCAGEGARCDPLQLLEGAEVAAQAGLPRPFVGQAVRLFVAVDADVGRDPLNQHMPFDERTIVQPAHSVYERAIGSRFVMFGDDKCRVCAVESVSECSVSPGWEWERKSERAIPTAQSSP